MEIRSFLAFELPTDIKRIVDRVAGEVRRFALEVRWVKTDNIHLTVVFLGRIKGEEIETIGKAVETVCLDHGPFDISLSGIGCFPNRRNPRVLWLGLEGDLERMAYFRDALQKQLKPFEIKLEKRPFKPHLTLGRFRKPNRSETRLHELMSAYSDLTSPVCSLNELILFRSDLNPGGAVYTKMLSWTLSGEK
ncbi:MAG: RNA 2',3'-cyclic phosphodiesterase [Desulfobacteraceae bacterium]|jgi:2'-5' RNA ligase